MDACPRLGTSGLADLSAVMSQFVLMPYTSRVAEKWERSRPAPTSRDARDREAISAPLRSIDMADPVTSAA